MNTSLEDAQPESPLELKDHQVEHQVEQNIPDQPSSNASKLNGGDIVLMVVGITLFSLIVIAMIVLGAICPVPNESVWHSTGSIVGVILLFTICAILASCILGAWLFLFTLAPVPIFVFTYLPAIGMAGTVCLVSMEVIKPTSSMGPRLRAIVSLASVTPILYAVTKLLWLPVWLIKHVSLQQKRLAIILRATLRMMKCFKLAFVGTGVQLFLCWGLFCFFIFLPFGVDTLYYPLLFIWVLSTIKNIHHYWVVRVYRNLLTEEVLRYRYLSVLPVVLQSLGSIVIASLFTSVAPVFYFLKDFSFLCRKVHAVIAVAALGAAKESAEAEYEVETIHMRGSTVVSRERHREKGDCAGVILSLIATVIAVFLYVLSLVTYLISTAMLSLGVKYIISDMAFYGCSYPRSLHQINKARARGGGCCPSCLRPARANKDEKWLSCIDSNIFSQTITFCCIIVGSGCALVMSALNPTFALHAYLLGYETARITLEMFDVINLGTWVAIDYNHDLFKEKLRDVAGLEMFQRVEDDARRIANWSRKERARKVRAVQVQQAMAVLPDGGMAGSPMAGPVPVMMVHGSDGTVCARDPEAIGMPPPMAMTTLATVQPGAAQGMPDAVPAPSAPPMSAPISQGAILSADPLVPVQRVSAEGDEAPVPGAANVGTLMPTSAQQGEAPLLPGATGISHPMQGNPIEEAMATPTLHSTALIATTPRPDGTVSFADAPLAVQVCGNL